MTPTLHFYDLGPSVVAFSSTRQGGFSVGPYAAFNINHYCGDDEEHIALNRHALCQLLQVSDDRLLMPHQTHDTRVATIDEAFLALSPESRQAALEGVDAVMTCLAGVCIGVSTADCIPVLLYDEEHHAVCAVHAGWRGTVKRIVMKAVAAMTTRYGTLPEHLVAQIGPGISLDSFEVGDEVYDAFRTEGFEMSAISRRYRASDDATKEKWHIDLPLCNRLQLLEAGLPAHAISVLPVCTFQQSERFFSARRLGINSGRIFTGICLRP
ncbi:MAG: peptidoglycan editing factor PgeF [Prevotella sp.]|nr:peptidoglycan editing factor PgeF [Prevotella sp.]